MMSYGSAGSPFVREAVRTSCVNLFATRARMRFAEAGAETKTHSNFDCLVVESQPACWQRESVELIIAMGCRCCREPSSVEVVCEGRHDDGLVCHYPWSVPDALLRVTWWSRCVRVVDGGPGSHKPFSVVVYCEPTVTVEQQEWLKTVGGCGGCQKGG